MPKVGTATIVGLALSAAASSAQAACTPPLAAVFASYGDTALYTVVPGGNFETGAAGWTLKDARVVAESTNHLKVGPDAFALEIAPGGSATSPAFCVTRDYRGVRAFGRAMTATGTSAVAIDLLYRGRPLTTSTFTAGANWVLSPSLSLLDLARLLPPGLEAMVQIRVRPVGKVAWQIDDIHVDPRMR